MALSTAIGERIQGFPLDDARTYDTVIVCGQRPNDISLSRAISFHQDSALVRQGASEL